MNDTLRRDSSLSLKLKFLMQFDLMSAMLKTCGRDTLPHHTSKTFKRID